MKIEFENYEIPEVEIMEVNVEKGFQASGGGAGGESGEEGM